MKPGRDFYRTSSAVLHQVLVWEDADVRSVINLYHNVRHFEKVLRKATSKFIILTIFRLVTKNI